jgi:hypothetical protein
MAPQLAGSGDIEMLKGDGAGGPLMVIVSCNFSDLPPETRTVLHEFLSLDGQALGDALERFGS